MQQTIFTILENRPLTDAVWHMTLRGDTGAITAPGQFVNISLSGLFLRRPISVCDLEGDRLTLIFKVVGQGTAQLSRMEAGEQLDLLTGLGNGYDLNLAGEHPLHGFLDHAAGILRADDGGGQHDVAAAPAGEALVGLLRLLAAGELGLGGVDDDDERAGVDPRGVVGLVLAAEGVGDVDGETADGLLRRVDEDPLAVLAGILGEERVHVFSGCIA